jgi:CHRD domain-containing protein
MKPIFRTCALTIVAASAASFAMGAFAADVSAKLAGAQEVPPVQTMASGSAHFTVKDDMSISGSVKTEGIKGIAAHIHDGAPGQNGGVVVPLTATGANEWSVPKDAKLTKAQMDKLAAGDLYVNVHSDAHKDGEIRGQLKE